MGGIHLKAGARGGNLLWKAFLYLCALKFTAFKGQFIKYLLIPGNSAHIFSLKDAETGEGWGW